MGLQWLPDTQEGAFDRSCWCMVGGTQPLNVSEKSVQVAQVRNKTTRSCVSECVNCEWVNTSMSTWDGRVNMCTYLSDHGDAM
jgi:hypothetical protein